MTTKQYVKKYRLDVSEYANHFNTDLFLQDLNDEWHQRMDKEIAYRKSIDQNFEFQMFQRIIMELQQKFMAISNKKAGGPLRRELWNAFYAKYIIPERAKLFPGEHEEIRIKRLIAQRDKLAEDIRNKLISDMGPKFQEIKEQGGSVYKTLLNNLTNKAREQAEMQIPI